MVSASSMESSAIGSMFTIVRVNRLHMGAYLCIASNGVPPSVSKRITLIVHCKFSFIFHKNHYFLAKVLTYIC